MPFRKIQSTQQDSFTGCKTNSHREHFMSSGVGSLDDVFGGGLPLGSLFLLKGDRRTGYSNLLLRYMAAQGLESQQTVLLLGTKRSISDILEELPTAVKIEDAIDDGDDSVPTLGMRPGRVMGAVRTDEKMKIAWRYQSLPQVSQSSLRPSMTNASIPFLSMFDITKPRSVESFLRNGQLQFICYSEQDEETSLYKLITRLPDKLERLKNL
jgi:elongator complex protein 4